MEAAICIETRSTWPGNEMDVAMLHCSMDMLQCICMYAYKLSIIKWWDGIGYLRALLLLDGVFKERDGQTNRQKIHFRDVDNIICT